MAGPTRLLEISFPACANQYSLALSAIALAPALSDIAQQIGNTNCRRRNALTDLRNDEKVDGTGSNAKIRGEFSLRSCASCVAMNPLFAPTSKTIGFSTSRHHCAINR